MIKKIFGSIVLFNILMFPTYAVSTNVVTLDKQTLEKPELELGNSSSTTVKGSLLLEDSETSEEVKQWLTDNIHEADISMLKTTPDW